jgi:hypothetical protein
MLFVVAKAETDAGQHVVVQLYQLNSS